MLMNEVNYELLFANWMGDYLLKLSPHKKKIILKQKKSLTISFNLLGNTIKSKEEFNI